MMPAAMPMTMAPEIFTNPAAGVMATSPPTAPDARPRTVGFPECSHSMNIQDRGETARAGAALEPDPAEPQEPGAGDHEGEVARQDGLFLPLAEDQGAHERRDAGIDMHHSPARDVECPELEQEASAPDPVGDRTIDNGHPEHGEQY